MEAYIVPIPRGTIAFLKSAFKLGLTTSPLLLIYNFYILYYYWTVGDVSIVEATPSVTASQSYLSWAITAPFNLVYDYAYTIIETASVYANFFKGDPLVFADDDIYSLRTTIDTIDLTEPVAVTSVVDFIAHSDKFNVTVHAGLEEMLNDTIAFIPGMSYFLNVDEFSRSALLRNGLTTLSKAYKSPITPNNGDMSAVDAASNSASISAFSAANGSFEREHVLKWLSVPEMQPLHDDLAMLLAQEVERGEDAGEARSEGDIAEDATTTSASTTTSTSSPSSTTTTTSSDAKHPSPMLLWDLIHIQHARAHAYALSLAPTTDTATDTVTASSVDSATTGHYTSSGRYVASADYAAAKDAAQRILSSLSNMAMDRGEALPLSPAGFTMHTIDILQSAKSEGIKIPENIQYSGYTYLDVGFVAVTLLRCIISPLQILIRIYLLTQLHWIEKLPVEEMRVVLMHLNSGWAFQIHHLIGLVLMKMTYALIGLVLVRLFCPTALSSLYYSALMALVVHFVVMAKAMMVMQLAVEGEYDPEIADEATTRVLGEVAAAGRMSAEEVKKCTVVCDAHVARMCEHVVSNDTCAICMCDFELGRFAEMEGDSNSNGNGSDNDGYLSSTGSINTIDSSTNASGSGEGSGDAVGKCEIVRVLGCGHYFHLQCVDHWLMKNKSICPTCRESAIHSEETVMKLRQDVRDTSATRRQTQIQKVISDLTRAYAAQTSAVIDRVVIDSEESDEKDEFKATDNVLRQRSTNTLYTSPIATSTNNSVDTVTEEALTSSLDTMYSSIGRSNSSTGEEKKDDLKNVDEEEEDDLEPLEAVFDSIFNTNIYNAPEVKNTTEAANDLASPQSIMATEEDNEWLRNFADGDDGPNDIAADFNAIVESFAKRNKVKAEQEKEDGDEVTMQPDEILELIEEMEKFVPQS